MKKILTILLSMLMILSLVGCGPKDNQTEKQEEIKNEVEEVSSGVINANNPTMTDDLQKVFDSALEGLLGASYEAIGLVSYESATKTYKFLAEGTKTTNPETKGTYYITIVKNDDGAFELKDIETKEEKQEEVKTQDLTSVSFWVVFYDQYGNELQREALKYGSVPEYKGKLPVGFDKWIYKKSGKDVNDFKAITTNTYFQAVCHKVEHSANYSVETPACVNTEDLYFIEGNALGSIYPDQNMAVSSLFQYSGGAFVFTDYDDLRYVRKQALGVPVEKNHWYHLINEEMVECSDPNHHNVNRPYIVGEVIDTVGKDGFNWTNSLTGASCHNFNGYSLEFSHGSDDKQYINYNKILTKSDNNWLYEDDKCIVHFNMFNNVLNQIYVESKYNGSGWEPYALFYIAPSN